MKLLNMTQVLEAKFSNKFIAHNVSAIITERLVTGILKRIRVIYTQSSKISEVMKMLSFEERQTLVAKDNLVMWSCKEDKQILGGEI